MRLRTSLAAIAILLVFLIPAPAVVRAADVPARPGTHVVDLAGIVDAGVQSEINRTLRELEQKTGAQVAVLTVASLQGRPIEDFSISVAHDKWKLGQKGKDNGVLVVVALKDRKYRIEVGYGLESVLPDSLVGSIGRNLMVPYFKKGDYSDGIYAATLAIANKIAAASGVKITGPPGVPNAIPGKRPARSQGILGKILGLVFVLVLLLFFIRHPRMMLALFLMSAMGGRGGFWGGSGGGGFGGGGFGGFSGGGGGFGGGGASGGW